MRHPSFGNLFFITTWPTAHNKCMKIVTEQPVENVDGERQFDSMANFRRPDDTLATTGVLTRALATMINCELQVLDSSSVMNWADVVSVAHTHTNKNKKDSNFYVVWAQGSDAIQSLLKERQAGPNCIIKRAPIVMLAAFGLRQNGGGSFLLR